MRTLRTTVFLLSVALLPSGCMSDSGSDPLEDIVAPEMSGTATATGTATPTDGPQRINPDRGWYDVVVLDMDRWELCLNVKRQRRHVTSYDGHMWYRSGAFVFEGELSAMWDPRLEILTVIAFDAGYDRGHILYSMAFDEDENIENVLTMQGTFVYYEYPWRANWVTAWLEQGVIGEHNAGPWTPSDTYQPHANAPADDHAVPTTHPKADEGGEADPDPVRR